MIRLYVQIAAPANQITFVIAVVVAAMVMDTGLAVVQLNQPNFRRLSKNKLCRSVGFILIAASFCIKTQAV
jgi:hypothetical protein